jgi:hypothetical protein
LLDTNENYKLNYNEGNTLELDIFKKWGLEGFDAVIGNPPYNGATGTGGSRKLWDKFVIIALDKWVIPNTGFLSYVHPPNWRKPDNKIFQKIKKYDLLSLNILNDKQGKMYFQCATKADYYLIRKSNIENKTIINNEYYIDIQNMNFIPNCDNSLFNGLKGNHDGILCPNTSYSSDMKWMTDDYSLPYKYLLTTNSSQKKYKYSDKQKNFYGYKKVIISLGRYPYPINDFQGEYGLSCYNFAIKINSYEEGENMCRAINSIKFQNLLKNNKWGSYNIEWRMFKYFKKDFWKEFIEEE